MLISRFMFLKCSGSRKLVVLCRLSVEEIRMKYGGWFPSERWVSPGDAELWDQKPSGDFISCFYPFFLLQLHLQRCHHYSSSSPPFSSFTPSGLWTSATTSTVRSSSTWSKPASPTPTSLTCTASASPSEVKNSNETGASQEAETFCQKLENVPASAPVLLRRRTFTFCFADGSGSEVKNKQAFTKMTEVWGCHSNHTTDCSSASVAVTTELKEEVCLITLITHTHTHFLLIWVNPGHQLVCCQVCVSACPRLVQTCRVLVGLLVCLNVATVTETVASLKLSFVWLKLWAAAVRRAAKDSGTAGVSCLLHRQQEALGSISWLSCRKTPTLFSLRLLGPSVLPRTVQSASVCRPVNFISVCFWLTWRIWCWFSQVFRS